MKKFDVEITETLQRKVSVEAASQEDAERMVTQAWNNQDYVLDSGDFTGVDFGKYFRRTSFLIVTWSSSSFLISFITSHMASKVQPPSCESFFSRCACDRDGDACA